MIVITYAPPGLDSRTWEIDEFSWTYGEVVEIERQYGGTRKEFFEDARVGSDTARRILLWMIRRRTEPDLTLDELDGLLVSFLGFWQAKPADPKADAADEAADKSEPTKTPDQAPELK